MDLNETLVHVVDGDQNADVEIDIGGEDLCFNIRPYCFGFLERMSRFYNIYVFTA